MSPGRFLWLLRRDLRRGLAATWHDYITTPRILDWKNPFAHSPQMPLPVHVLAGHEHAPLTAWMLASWFYFTQKNWPICLHDDGTLQPADIAMLANIAPGLRFIAVAEADSRMATALASLPLCRAYRDAHPLGKKIFDVPTFATHERFILLDSDLLFFRRPDAILQWAQAEDTSCWFNADAQEPCMLSFGMVKKQYGFDLWPRVNSGLCLIAPQTVDLDFCEQILSETPLLQTQAWRVEQTLFALCASRRGQGGLLPPAYEVSFGKRCRRDAITRHYVGAVRQSFYGEGVRRLKKSLLR